MPRGYRCILVAFVGWLSLATTNPKNAASNPQGATDREVASALNNLAAALKQSEKPNKHDEPCDPPNNKRTSDLCAQWKAADAAKSAAQAAWWIGAIGTLIGALTLAAAWAAALYAKDAAKHTKAGADEAKRAADAAERGLRHSQEITKTELRAYLAAEKEVFAMDGNDCNLTVHLRNVGQTPAQEVATTRSTWIAAGRRKPMTIRFPDQHSKMGTVGPKVPIENFNDITLRTSTARAFRAGIASINILIVVQFEDMFGDRWRYEQTIWADKRSIKSGTIFTAKCETRLDVEDPQGKLNLKSPKRGRKKKGGT